MKRFASLAGLLLFNLMVVLVLLEVALRLFPVLIPLQRLVDFDPEIRAEIAKRRGLPTLKNTRLVPRDDGGPPLRLYMPNATIYRPSKDEDAVKKVRMDRLGFCNPPQLAAQPRTDLITIGDSFTFCTGVEPESTWTHDLGHLAGLSAYNLGRPNIGLREYLQIFKQYGIARSPRIVIMNIYEGNDLRDAVYYREYRRLAMNDAAPRADDKPGSDSLIDQSYVLNLVGFVGGDEGEGLDVERAKAYQRALKKKYYPINFQYHLQFPDKTTAFNLENTDRDEPMYALALREGQISPEVFQDIERTLEEFIQLSRQHHFVPVVTYTPSAHIAYAANVVFDDARLTELMPWFSQLQRDFFGSHASLGYVFIDLTPSLQDAVRRAGPGQLLYNRYDLHLTRTGHKVLAGIIHQTLRGRRLLPAGPGP